MGSLAELDALATLGTAISPWALFVRSFDFFTIVLLLGSVAALTLIVRNVLDVRAERILPERSIKQIVDMIEAKRWGPLREYVTRDSTFLSRVVAAGVAQPHVTRQQIREAAEVAASEQCADWFRKIEPLNVIGNLAPLVGLAGTVWGMILAFTSLGATGGEAGPAELSAGIAKALFHTLLGLCLAIPCLLTFGLYRSKIDKHCTRGIVLATELIEHLPATDDPKHDS